MPLYTALIEEGSIPDEIKAKIAEDITDIHTSVMKVPRSFVRVIFLSYPRGSGYSAGKQAAAAALDCTLRNGHTAQEKTDLLLQLWAVFQRHTGIPTDHLAISVREIPSTNAMEMGQIMRPVGQDSGVEGDQDRLSQRGAGTNRRD
jgi:phenylpyruvate tautomerase PptA (4-oxalocrotonate tautomerase family)